MTRKTAKKYANLIFVESIHYQVVPQKVEDDLGRFQWEHKPAPIAAAWFRSLADALEEK